MELVLIRKLSYDEHRSSFGLVKHAAEVLPKYADSDELNAAQKHDGYSQGGPAWRDNHPRTRESQYPEDHCEPHIEKAGPCNESSRQEHPTEREGGKS